MSAAKVFIDPHNLALDSAAPTGCTSISFQSSSQPNSARSDDGTYVHFVPAGAIRGTINFIDPIQAAIIAQKGAAGSLDLTFDVVDEAGTDATVTIVNCKTGGVGSGFAGMTPGPASVAFVADSVSNPT